MLTMRRSVLKACKRGSAGFTILEMLLVAGLVGIIVTMVGELTMTSFRHYRRSESGQQNFRQASLALDLLNREMRTCQKIVWPNYGSAVWQKGKSIKAGTGGRLAFIFKRMPVSDDKGALVGYVYDGKKGTLVRRLYRADFTPRADNVYADSGVLESRALMDNLQELTFYSLDSQENYGSCLLGVKMRLPNSQLIRQVGKKKKVINYDLLAEVRAVSL